MVFKVSIYNIDMGGVGGGGGRIYKNVEMDGPRYKIENKKRRRMGYRYITALKRVVCEGIKGRGGLLMKKDSID